MNKSMVVLHLFFLSLFILSPFPVSAKIPGGYEGTTWGISVAELTRLTEVSNAVTEGLFYAEHFEWNPEVYISSKPDGKKIEYYFYQNKLYKIFIIHPLQSNRQKFNLTDLYENLLKKMLKDYGQQSKTYKEEMFGFVINNHVWEDSETKLYLRSGAGYVYNVFIHKQMNIKKKKDMRESLNKKVYEKPRDGMIDL